MSENSLRVRWNQLQIPNGVLYYEVSVISPEGVLVQPTLLQATNTEFNINGITPGYFFNFLNNISNKLKLFFQVQNIHSELELNLVTSIPLTPN